MATVFCARNFLLLGLFSFLSTFATGFYIPGVGPNEYSIGEVIEVKAVKLTSVKKPLPYQYYFLPFCRPEKLRNAKENLGEVLRGDRIVNTLYRIPMAKNVTCRYLCQGDGGPARHLSKSQLIKFDRFIKNQYRVHWLLDNLPSATKLVYEGQEKYAQGFPLGFVNSNKNSVLFNHLVLVGKVTKGNEPDKRRIVGFEVRVRSVGASRYGLVEGTTDDCTIKPGDENVELDFNKIGEDGGNVVWSYSVFWEDSDIPWTSRWDHYLAMDDQEIHWLSILNSLVTVFFLSGIFAFILIRTLRKDIARYNAEDQEDAVEQTGWKLVHGDVFRPPANAFWLTVFVGTGIQLFCMFTATILLSMFGFLSPASRGSFVSAAIFLYVLFGLIGGYYGGRVYKTLKGEKWKQAAVATAILFPSIILLTSFILNFFIWGKQSSGAIPFTTMIVILLLWLGVSVPLVMIGYFFGFRKQAYEFPINTNQIPRHIPEQVWYLHPAVGMFVAGILPFGAVFIELYFILTAIWENQFYYLFGFLFLVFLILVVCCAEISIVMTYLQLCREDYQWWWKCFLISGGSAVYVFLYAIFYFVSKLEIDDLVSGMLYFGYSFLMVLTFWFLTGTIGFLATFAFVRIIYGSIKID